MGRGFPASVPAFSPRFRRRVSHPFHRCRGAGTAAFYYSCGQNTCQRAWGILGARGQWSVVSGRPNIYYDQGPAKEFCH